MKLTLPCPAKLNLFLHILRQRDDGYHELQTIFQLLDYGDELVLEPAPEGRLTLAPEIPGIHSQDNLVYRAALLLKQHTQCPLGANLYLKKILPTGGGIGGGSSDAASTLVGLNKLWNLHLSEDELAELGGKLGADIPVFVRGRSAWAEGVGEKLYPVEIPPAWYLVIAPECSVSTAQIFCHEELTRNTLPIKVRASLEEGGRNDCQPLVETLYPQVKDAVDWLSLHGTARLTGTGACVFARFATEEEAQRVFTLRPAHMKGFVARGVNESPLHQRLRT